jgi:N-acyl homoserine lactone hydrolase
MSEPATGSTPIRVTAVQTGSLRIRPTHLAGRMDHPAWRRRLAILRDKDWTAPLPIHTFLVEHPEGLILFDSGEIARAATKGYFPRWLPARRLADLQVGPQDEVGPRLQAMGIDPRRDLAALVLSHLHYDHADGLGYFQGTRTVVSQANWRAAQGLRGTLQGALPKRWPAWFDPDRITVDGPALGPWPRSYPLTADGRVVAVETPGHMPGHLSLIVFAAGITYLLAGDATFGEDLARAEIVDGAQQDIAAGVRTLRAIKDFCRQQPVVLLPAHDPFAVQRLAGAVPFDPDATPAAAAGG